MKARAEMATREAALRDGQLIDANHAKAVLAHFLVLFRQRLLWIPNRTRPDTEIRIWLISFAMKSARH